MSPTTFYVRQARAITAIATAITATVTDYVSRNNSKHMNGAYVNRKTVNPSRHRIYHDQFSNSTMYVYSEHEYETFSERKRISTYKQHPNYQLREHATRLLTLATVMDPIQTSDALRVARRTTFFNSDMKDENENKFLRKTLSNTISRALASGIGVGVAVYTVLALTVSPIPVIRLCVITVGGLATLIEIGNLQDVTMVELLLNTDSNIGKQARYTIEKYYPQSFLLGLLPPLAHDEDDDIISMLPNGHELLESS